MKPVLILGAGSAGLAIAQALKKASIPFEIYDTTEVLKRRRRRRVEPIAIDRFGLEALKEILSPTLLKALEGRSTRLFELGPHVWHCDAQDLNDILLADLNNDISIGKDLSIITPTDDGVEAIFNDGRKSCGSVVVGSTGTWPGEPSSPDDSNVLVMSIEKSKAGQESHQQETQSRTSQSPTNRKRRLSFTTGDRPRKRSKSSTPSLILSTTSLATSANVSPQTPVDPTAPLQAANVFTELSTWRDDRLRTVWHDATSPLEVGGWVEGSGIGVVAEASKAITPDTRAHIALALHHAAKLELALRNELTREVTFEEASDIIQPQPWSQTPSDGPGVLQAASARISRPLEPRRLVPWR